MAINYYAGGWEGTSSATSSYTDLECTDSYVCPEPAEDEPAQEPDEARTDCKPPPYRVPVFIPRRHRRLRRIRARQRAPPTSVAAAS